MEVHPPEHPIFTWKQFFIHMATVCLGLLIAISLEQSVEALHRDHQRHQLKSDLRAEAIHNLHIAIYNLDIIENLDHWQTQQVAELDRAAAEGRPARYIPEPAAARAYRLPSEAVWTVAQTGTVNLLPRAEAQQFAHPYSVERFVADDVSQLNHLIDERDEILDSASTVPFLSRLAAGRNNTYDLSRLSKDDLGRFRDVATSLVSRARGFERDKRTSTALPGERCTDIRTKKTITGELKCGEPSCTTAEQPGILKKFPIPDDNAATPKEDK
jgi:hypothetical protein